MAEKRMFSKKITDSDAFIEMPASAQALYYHLNQGADDDGFNNQIQMAMMKAHASVDDLKVLMAKNFIFKFSCGVIVVKHWRMHNTLRKDRYTPTNYQDEFKLLNVKENGSYTLQMETDSKPAKDLVANWLPQNRLDKISKDKNNIDYYTNNLLSENEPEIVEEINEKEEIFNFWNEKNIIKHRNLTKEIEKALEKALKNLNKDIIIECIDRYSKVLSDNLFYFDYKWSLTDFLNRKNGISSFTDEGSMWVSYITSKNKNNQITNENVDNISKQLEERINARKGNYGI